MKPVYPFRKRGHYFNPHHKPFYQLSLQEAWDDYALWIQEVFLWVTGLKTYPGAQRCDRQAFQEAMQRFPVPQKIGFDRPIVEWIGHTTFHLRYADISLLTDPIWSDRCSPVQWAGPKRTQAPAKHLANLPKVDLVLLSHDHYDHCDTATLQALYRQNPKVKFFVPLGCRRLVERYGFENITELGWWESQELLVRGVHLQVTCVPAQHNSGRGVFDHNTTLWCGWTAALWHGQFGNKICYFAGDTGYNPIDFQEIGRKLGPMDLSLIPIGAYLPRQILSGVHVDPSEALLIHKEVGSRISLASHFGTFDLAQEDVLQPVVDLCHALDQKGSGGFPFLAPHLGACYNW